MFTLNNILEEIKDIPVDRLDEVYQFVHSLNPKVKNAGRSRKKILSFAGSLKEMNAKDYAEFQKETKKIRKGLFERKIDI